MTVVLGDILLSGEVSPDQELLKSIPNISGRYQLVEQLTTEPPPPLTWRGSQEELGKGEREVPRQLDDSWHDPTRPHKCITGWLDPARPSRVSPNHRARGGQA